MSGAIEVVGDYVTIWSKSGEGIKTIRRDTIELIEVTSGDSGIELSLTVSGLFVFKARFKNIKQQ